jgi:hypothetical protein
METPSLTGRRTPRLARFPKGEPSHAVPAQRFSAMSTHEARTGSLAEQQLAAKRLRAKFFPQTLPKPVFIDRPAPVVRDLLAITSPGVAVEEPRAPKPKRVRESVKDRETRAMRLRNLKTYRPDLYSEWLAKRRAKWLAESRKKADARAAIARRKYAMEKAQAEAILSTVAAAHGFQPAEVFSRRRYAEITTFRWEVILTLHARMPWSFLRIAQFLKLDHTSAMNAHRSRRKRLFIAGLWEVHKNTAHIAAVTRCDAETINAAIAWHIAYLDRERARIRARCPGAGARTPIEVQLRYRKATLIRRKVARKG